MLKAGTAARRRTVRLGASLAPDAVRIAVEDVLHTLDQRLKQRDARWGGHCKLLVTAGEQTAYASLTAAGDRPRWAGTPVELAEAEATIYVAIYGWTDADVAEALDGALATTWETLFGDRRAGTA